MTTQTTPTQAPATVESDAFARAPLAKRLFQRQETWIIGVLALIFIIFAALAPHAFPSAGNITNIMSNAAVLLVLGVGSTFVIVTGGIDLSVNGVLVFAGVIAAEIMKAMHGSLAGIIVGLVAAIVSGLAWGAVNGILIGKARIPALIVTLGSTGAALGAALLITGGVDVTDVPLKLTLTLGSGRVAGIPWLVIVAALIAIIGAIVLAYTRFGRHTYAAGSNPEALRRSGVSTSGHLVKVYTLAGTLSGVAGFLSLARFATTTISGHSTDNLQTIAEVVIGGTSLFGGIGTVVGTIIGTFIPVTLSNGFVVLGLQPYWQQVAIGAVLVAAVFVDQLRRRARNK